MKWWPATQIMFPMGNFFRTSPVSVIDAAQRLICHGVEPEAGIIELMDRALSILNHV